MNSSSPGITVKILPNDSTPAGKLADAELHFHSGPLAGLRLLGFGVWARRTGAGRNVTFPARSYSVNGERRSFGLLRPQDSGNPAANDAMRDLVLQAYDAHEQQAKEDAKPATQTPAMLASFAAQPITPYRTDIL